MPIGCLAKISPMNVSTGSRVDIYVTSNNDRRVTGLNGQVWEPALVQAPQIGIALWNGDFTAAVEPARANLAINMTVAQMTWPGADAYMWSGAPVEIYAEELGTAWPWTKRFAGKVSGYSRRSQVLTLTAEADKEPFQKNLLVNTYAGTGGAEGGTDLKNRPKPLVMGWAQNVEPVLIDAVNNIYQFSGYGAIEAVSVLYERGSDFGSSSGDYANYAALVVATVAAGTWATCLAEGMIRLGAPAYGVITGDVKGHKIGGSTPRLPGSVINGLLTITGISTSLVNLTTLAALDTAVPYPINIVVTEQTTFLEMAQKIALSCNWQAGVSMTGLFFASAISLSGSTALSLNAQGATFPQVISSDEVDVSPPYYKTILGANHAWRVHTAEETALTTPAEELAAAAMADIIDISSDNILSPPKKPSVILDYNTITAEQSGIDTRATALGITTEKTAYDTAISALTTYMATLTTPVAWNNLTDNTTIVGTTFRSKFQDVFTAKQALLNKIDEVSATKATWGGVTGTGGQPSGSDVAATVSPGGGVASNQVSTGSIQANQVTTLSSVYTPASAGSVSIPHATWTEVQTLTVSTTGAPVAVNVCLQNSSPNDDSVLLVYLYRGSTVIAQLMSYVPMGGASTESLTMIDTPPAGTNTYKVKVFENNTSLITYVNNRFLSVLELKR